MFQRLWGGQEAPSGQSSPRMKLKQAEPETIKDDQPLNPYTEIQILQHHKDIVRHLIAVDEERFVSAGDDGVAVVWDIGIGRKICTLIGHTRQITSLLVLKPHIDPVLGMYNSSVYILTAASDKQMRVWDIESGECIQVISEHASYVKCLLSLDEGDLVCSGGEKLCLWDRKGNMLHEFTRNDNEEENNSVPADVHLLILIKNDQIVAACEKQLVVYSINDLPDVEGGIQNKQLERVRKLRPHREAIRALINVSEATFASGSLDGTIILWTTHSHSPTRYFNSQGEYEGMYHDYPHCIQHMICVEGRYVVAAIGSGYCVYDIIASKHLARKYAAHLSKIVHLELVYNGCFLATCSEDGAVRLWGNRKYFNKKEEVVNKLPASPSVIERLLGTSKEGLKKLMEEDKYVEPDLLGECLAHSGTVQKMLDFGQEGFATCGLDGLVIIWRDGVVRTKKRVEIARDMVLGEDLQ
ncbi:WD repeat-containing protein 41-like [Lineus longissimus]|uniref:WD repeat-containing protein 41-like n=1 Tax=Lineus longissimus TaxID=88925 RepID=UPI00315D90D7